MIFRKRMVGVFEFSDERAQQKGRRGDGRDYVAIGSRMRVLGRIGRGGEENKEE